MNRSEFLSTLPDVLLLDGATGSNLMSAGMPRGVCTEAWILDHPEAILALQRAYIEAGSQLLYAPTFGGNRVNLKKHGLEDELSSINSRLVALSKEAARGEALIAGDLTTSGEMMEPLGSYSYEEALSVYCEQIEVLDRAGVDLFIAETMISLDESLAAVDACLQVSEKPILVTLTAASDGSLFTGGMVWEACEALAEAGASAVGINCSVGPDQLESVVASIRAAVSVPVIAKPNAGMPIIDEKGNARYEMTPADFARHMKTLISAGASIVGGCCGTTPDFIRALSKELQGA